MRARLIFIIVIAFSAGTLIAILMGAGRSLLPLQSGKALIGGPFTLTDQTGRTVSDRDFRGKYMLVSFGYTYCPNVCPAELNVMSEALNKLGSDGRNIVPIFITIDPARDTVEQMANYMPSFHPRMVGLTGTEEQIKQAASAYRVFYSKADGDKAGDGYLMDHSTFMYLMNPAGEYVTHFGYGISADDLAARLAEATGGSGV
jgi:protein SCO1/2